jgi:hypothetical protein
MAEHDCFDHGSLRLGSRGVEVGCSVRGELLALPHQIDHAAWGFDNRGEQKELD